MHSHQLKALVFLAWLIPNYLPIAAVAEDSTPISGLMDRERIQLHGYLTQAFAESTDLGVNGIPTNGTSEYRNLALQLRLQTSDQSNFVVQLSHEAVGDSPAADLNDEVELDWAFYEYRLPSDTALRFGRIAIPFGIYNEIRDVGTLLPFFLPPQTLYSEGIFANETVDGLTVSHSFFGSSGWGLDTSLFYGEWEVKQFLTLNTAEVQDAFGIQLWLETPIPGVRLGAAGRTGNYEGLDGTATGESVTFNDYLFSVEAELDKVTARAEMIRLDFGTGATVESGYVQLGFRVFDRLALFLSSETSNLIRSSGAKTDFTDDVAFSVSYSVKPNFIVRLEHHWYEGFNLDDIPDDYLLRFGLTNEPYKTQYSVLSIATSF